MADVAALKAKLASHGQDHLLGFYDQLSQPQQLALLEQIEAIDFDRLDKLIAQYIIKQPDTHISGKIEPVEVVVPNATDQQEIEHITAAKTCGEELIAEGKVAAFVVAGGQGTRLGYEGPKGCLESTPVSHKPLFQIFAEQVLAASKRSGATIPFYVMTSPANDVAVRAFFRAHNNFGLAADDVFFLTQGTMPAISFDGKVLLSGLGELALSPNGHGGSLQALADSGALADMETRGIEYISYFHVDNPLVRVIDPLFIGLHVLGGANMSAKCLPKRDPMEPLGNLCQVDGKTTVIEYSDMAEELARATTDDGHLRFSAGSIGVHIFSRPFVVSITADTAAMRLPLHRADKVVPFIDSAGQLVKPAQPNAVKLEMFVFDALALAGETVVLQTNRCEEFSPIKNATGADSLPTSLHDQIRRAASWLESAGVQIPRDAEGQVVTAIEISPLFADSAEQLAGKIDPKMVISTSQSVYLGD